MPVVTLPDLSAYNKVGICGGPKTGKTTLSGQINDRPVLHTDDAMDRPWADQPEIWIGATKELPRFCIEGVQVARAMRKGLQLDCLIVLCTPRMPLNKGQTALTKSVHRWLAEAAHLNPHLKVFYL